jgi:hypothetical protein
MVCVRHTAEQFINKLRDSEVLLGQGMMVPEVTRQKGVLAQTYYRGGGRCTSA